VARVATDQDSFSRHGSTRIHTDADFFEKQATDTFCQYPWLALRILSVNIRVNPWLEIQN